MKKILLALCALALLTGCDKDDDNSSTTSGPSVEDFNWVVDEVGSDFTVTAPNGTTTNLNGDFIVGWDTGQLLELNYFKGIRIVLPDGYTLYLTYNLTADMDWKEELDGANGLNQEPFQLAWSQDMQDKYVELYMPSNDEIETHASGTVDSRIDIPIQGVVYDFIGVIDATFNTDAGTYSVEGQFWVKDM